MEVNSDTYLQGKARTLIWITFVLFLSSICDLG